MSKAELPASCNGTEKSDLGLVDPSIESLQLGVWRVLLRRGSDAPREGIEASSWIVVRRFLREVWDIAPILVMQHVFTRVWNGVVYAIFFYCGECALGAVEASTIGGQPRNLLLLAYIGIQTCLSLLSAYIAWWEDHVHSELKTRIKYHFEEKLLEANLELDYAALLESSKQPRVTAEETWDAFSEITDTIKTAVSGISQAYYVVRIASRNPGAVLLGVCCVIVPLMHNMSYSYLLAGKAYGAYAQNRHYVRMKALLSLADSKYREEILNGNLGGHIMAEFRRTKARLNNASDDDPDALYELNRSVGMDIMNCLAWDLPFLCSVLSAFFWPSSVTPASIASFSIVQKLCEQIQMTHRNITVVHRRNLVQQIGKIRALYAVLDRGSSKCLLETSSNTIRELENKEKNGMKVEFRGVSFCHPGAEPGTSFALKNISFKISSGKRVAIVGENGSGKSSIVKLLARLYRPMSGEILIDGIRTDEIDGAILSEATAVLSQSHSIFPLTITENIGLGYPPSINDQEAIERAAIQGGAVGFIEKLPQMFGTVLHPVKTANLSEKADAASSDDAIKREIESMEKELDLSGGEKQKLAAARLFMRLNGSKVRLVVLDEPSSALDPKAELDFFKTLEDAADGATVIFVTHHLGNLTKFADLILCIENGAVAEYGRTTN